VYILLIISHSLILEVELTFEDAEIMVLSLVSH